MGGRESLDSSEPDQKPCVVSQLVWVSNDNMRHLSSGRAKSRHNLVLPSSKPSFFSSHLGCAQEPC